MRDDETSTVDELGRGDDRPKPDTVDREEAVTVEHGRPGPSGPTLAVRSGERYRLGSSIGRGGMGEVLAATDDQIGREVAVKRMKERHPSQHSMGRFFREACIQGRLDHPAIVPVHELGVDEDGRPFFTMKKLAGTTLADRIADDHPRQRLLRAFSDVCLAIEFAHSRGVIHRDIKPQNIVLGDFGEVYVLDWGVAKIIAEADEVAPPDLEVPAPVTADGTVIGTRGYMAPEQARAQPIDGRADVYSLGCVLFEILTGMPLCKKTDAPSGGPDVPPELEALCTAATLEDRELRIQSPRELGERVQRYLDGDRDHALRQDLAREHLIAARAAFIAGDGEVHRRTAMREAGRALALDPKLAGAAELVTRLMLEPPRDRPPEVQRSIDADNLETVRRQSRAGALGYLGFIVFIPTIIASGGPAGIWYALALGALIGANSWLLLSAWSFKSMLARSVRIAIGNAVLIALVARLTSPFFIAPGVAAIVTMVLVFSPTYTRVRAGVLLALLISVAILVPWLLEAAGAISPTMQLTADGISFQPIILIGSPTVRLATLVIIVMGMMSAAAGIALANRRAERSVQDRLHLQAWQLRQLVS